MTPPEMVRMEFKFESNQKWRENEEFEPLSDDEGVDTNDIHENDHDPDDVVPMPEIDPTPCDEDYDNYDSERILQIDESIEEEPTEESGKNTKLISDMNAYFLGFGWDAW